MKKSNASAPKSKENDLEFPDWSGMTDSTVQISVEAAFQLCEQYRAWFPEAAKKWDAQRPEKCLVEFVL